MIILVVQNELRRNNMIKKYDILYSRDNLNNIRTWQVEQEANKYRVKSGIKDSENLVVNEWTVVNDAKNSTTTAEQAQKECLALIKKKLKTGYSLSIDKVDTCLTYVEPMLAKKYKDYSDKIDFTKSNWGIQVKFNGNRCVATKYGLFTRKGEKYLAVPHIENALKPFFDKHPNAVLDGELYNYDLRQTLNELSKLVRRTVNLTAEDLIKSEKMVKFYVYDGYGFAGLDQDAKYSVRKDWIGTNIYSVYKYIESVNTYTIKNEDEMYNYFRTFIGDNEEGAILRDLDSGYENKRSKNLLKLKPEDDDECKFIEIHDGTGNWAGAATTVTVEWKDKTFDCTFKGTYKERAEILKNKMDWEGNNYTFQYLGLTGLGIPNSGRIDIHNCVKTDK